MNYHNITYDDMLNGDGLRAVLWVAGCEHQCSNCQNPITWDVTGGIPFDAAAKQELFEIIKKPHIAGVTFSGGDPLHPMNRQTIEQLMTEIKSVYPDKTIWLYTGYLWENICSLPMVRLVDVLVDGRYIDKLHNANLHWVGSSNQRVIDVQTSIATGRTVLKN